MKTFCFTTLALLAFAGNSVLCRLALAEQSIDAVSFTVIRLVSGICVLWLLVRIIGNNHASNSTGTRLNNTWLSALCLFIYAVAFSYAYIQLDTGTGALILFAAVQISMLTFALYSGESLSKFAISGFVLAISGFVYLVAPNLSTPSFGGFVLMAVSGLAWAAYTLLGKKSKNPIQDSYTNFVHTLPFICLISATVYFIAPESIDISLTGLLLATTSGAVASGIGYAIWYAALNNLSAANAAVLQLLVPVLAAFSGVIFLNEVLTIEFILSATMVLGGILMVILNNQKTAK